MKTSYKVLAPGLVTSSQTSLKLRKKHSVFVLLVAMCSVYVVAYIISGTSTISLAIASLASAIPFLINKNRAIRVQRDRDSSWPEALDSLVSALQSGIAIPEAVCSLSLHGPGPLRPLFQAIEDQLLAGTDFVTSLLDAKVIANSAIADQVFETLIYAKDFGGKDSNAALRLLSEFVREDLAVVEEISTKFGWIRNSATLATIAPWLLLLLLSTQEGTRNAFATMEGAKILMAGVFMTGIAYLWMEKVGSLPVPERALR